MTTNIHILGEITSEENVCPPPKIISYMNEI